MNPSELIDQQIASYPDWRGDLMARLRGLIHQAAPEIQEEWKWGTGVYTHNGLVCAVSAFKDHVKINFFEGASLPDPHRLLNSGLDAKAHRSINFYEGDEVREEELKELIRAAVDLKKE